MRAILADLKANEDATCWCPFESGQSASAVRYSHLFGIDVEFCTHLDSMLSEISALSMVAISASWLSAASGYSKARLAHLVSAGAILYVRGIPQQQRLTLSPFSDFRIALAPKFTMVGYRFTNSPLLPRALRGEATTLGPREVPAAVALPADAIHLMKAEEADGSEGTTIFSLRRGNGVVIFDLHPETGDAETPLVERLANPATRFEEVGALSAANLTMHSESERV